MPQYAVVDCAAGDDLYPLVQTEADSRSLLDGAISADLIDATPHIATLTAGGALAAQMWSGRRAIGIVCASPASLSQVRRQLRRNLQVLLPDGQAAMFRFFDPRVFPTHIQNDPQEGLVPWFGDISDWWVPIATGTWQYRCVAGQLAKQFHPRPQTAAR